MFRRLIKKHTSSGLRRALRELRFEFWMLRQHRAGVKAAQRFAAIRPLRLNLGSGVRSRQGFVNVDLHDDADLRLDLRERLPFEEGAADAIYSEHFFEHLEYPSVDDSTAWQLETGTSASEALTFLRECLRVLRPGGTLDIVVPDAECIVTEYADRLRQPFPKYEWWGPKWCDTAMHCVNYVFRQGREHKYAYDSETLARVLQGAGFTGVRRRPFDPSTDAPNHAIGSLCMQARKPAIAGDLVHSSDHVLQSCAVG